jgi:hypothetical protein
MKQFLLALTLATAATSALAADIAVGTVLAYDREAQTLVLTDRSVWSLAQVSAAIPGNLASGARVQFSYESDENAVADILQINVIRGAPERGATRTTEGTILAFDREARLLVFDDKSTWSLQGMRSEVPFGLDAGDRIEIEYEPRDDGVAIIYEISILLD